MLSLDVNFFVQLESRVWQALVDGDSQADAALLSEDFLGVYKNGFASRADHVDQLSHGPTVAEFRIYDAKLRVLSEGLVLLAYRAEWTRIRQGQLQSKDSAYISSIWEKQGPRWINIFSQDTEAAPCTDL